MDIQFIDTKVQTVSIDSIKAGEAFLTNDGMSDVCINLGLDTMNGEYHYLILGECPEICHVRGTYLVRPVKSKLIVEI